VVAVRWREERLVRYAIGIPNVREYGDPRVLVGLGEEAERAGWDGVFVWDHLVYQADGDPVADPWTTVTAVAARTERVRVGVLVMALARRRPWLVARQAATLDLLSGGRLVLGVGLGSLGEREFAAFGEDPDPRVRAARVDEGLAIITGLWSGERFAFDGEHFRVAPTVFRPVPLQTPRIPIWVGGRWPSRPPFRRAARFDGVFPGTLRGAGHTELPSPDQLAEIVAYTLGHRPATAGPLDVVLEGFTPGEDPGRAAARMRPYEQAGLTWWVEKLGWFRGSLDDARARVRQGPPGR
jgi:alkanesulfonate monooxygenase SsuD/methylene tetrahydromethanopterin reductase-like flavin-dependent oxidoreductase (luciferase family)